MRKIKKSSEAISAPQRRSSVVEADKAKHKNKSRDEAVRASQKVSGITLDKNWPTDAIMDYLRPDEKDELRGKLTKAGGATGKACQYLSSLLPEIPFQNILVTVCKEAGRVERELKYSTLKKGTAEKQSDKKSFSEVRELRKKGRKKKVKKKKISNGMSVIIDKLDAINESRKT